MRRHSAIPAAALAAAVAVLAGCAGMGTMTGGTPAGPAVGPGIDPPASAAADPYSGVRLDVIVPVFDPGLPEDPDDYEKEGVWPELRRGRGEPLCRHAQESAPGHRHAR